MCIKKGNYTIKSFIPRKNIQIRIKNKPHINYPADDCAYIDFCGVLYLGYEWGKCGNHLFNETKQPTD